MNKRSIAGIMTLVFAAVSLGPITALAVSPEAMLQELADGTVIVTDVSVKDSSRYSGVLQYEVGEESIRIGLAMEAKGILGTGFGTLSEVEVSSPDEAVQIEDMRYSLLNATDGDGAKLRLEVYVTKNGTAYTITDTLKLHVQDDTLCVKPENGEIVGQTS